MACPLSCILLLHIAVIIISQSPFVSSQNNTGKFSVGQSLLAKSNATVILSPSGDFAFGFHQFPNSSNLFLLSIWYAKIPDTIVWYANDGNPVPQGSKVTITADEGMILSDPQGTHLWNTSADFSILAAVSYGFMNDTGNFVLKTSSNNTAVWETFKFPTDTLLPSQVLQQGTEVLCRVSKSNFSSGRFQLRFQLDGNFVLYPRDVTTDLSYDAYYASGTFDGGNNPGNVGKQLVYNESGDMYIVTKNGSKVDVMSDINQLGSTKDYYQRVTLDSNGVLNRYAYLKASTGGSGVDWHRFQSVPSNICESVNSMLGSGACGYNSICTIDNDQQPVCNCPPSYSWMDANDTSGNCEPDFKPEVCEKFKGGVEDEYEMLQIKNTNFKHGDYANLNTSSEEECKNSCLTDCFCAAVILDNNSCSKKRLPLSNGRQSSSDSSTAWLKVGSGNATNDPNNQFIPQGNGRYKSNPVTTGMLGTSAAVNFILLTAILTILFYHKRKWSKRNGDHQTGSSLEHNIIVHSFPYTMLESATDGFREEVGRGSFGVVYKGRITVGGDSTTVAVKKLNQTFMGGDKEFMAEVNAIGVTHHKNLVRFIGYCKEEDKCLLVYEYMSNGTVADYLFGDSRPSWQSRIHIVKGVAKGLLYLHEDCTTQIIHCDIKPQNILVDDHYNARISDFGVAKLLVLNQTQTNTAFRGTKGYIAPEWFKNKPVSVKVDVYSFGVLLLEIVCCRRCVCLELSAVERTILTDWAFDCYKSDNLESLVNDDTEALNDMARLERFVKISLWCIQEDPNVRPTMQRVNQMLEGVAEVPNPPCQTSHSVTYSSGLIP